MSKPGLKRTIQRYRHVIGEVRRGRQPVFMEYPFDMKPRWADAVGNPHLARIIAAGAETYAKNLTEIAALKPAIASLKNGELPVSMDWRNIWMPALDGFTVMWAALRANATFMEVGSGNSTIFARAALAGAARTTKLVSIDPQPRAEIDQLCDEVIRAPMESVDLALVDRLGPGDTLFVDNSHQSFMNSDVTAFMLDVLPRLKPGVLVGVHDIFLPWDYPANWVNRAYNEQYLLAAWMIAAPQSLELQFANCWLHRHALHQAPLGDVWAMFEPDIVDRCPSALWAIKR